MEIWRVTGRTQLQDLAVRSIFVSTTNGSGCVHSMGSRGGSYTCPCVPGYCTLVIVRSARPQRKRDNCVHYETQVSSSCLGCTAERIEAAALAISRAAMLMLLLMPLPLLVEGSREEAISCGTRGRWLPLAGLDWEEATKEKEKYIG
eukprot:1161718-Pelagomonas_calceolata.AAC.9